MQAHWKMKCGKAPGQPSARALTTRIIRQVGTPSTSVELLSSSPDAHCFDRLTAGCHRVELIAGSPPLNSSTSGPPREGCVLFSLGQGGASFGSFADNANPSDEGVGGRLLAGRSVLPFSKHLPRALARDFCPATLYTVRKKDRRLSRRTAGPMTVTRLAC
jgi:hypothetical protein